MPLSPWPDPASASVPLCPGSPSPAWTSGATAGLLPPLRWGIITVSCCCRPFSISFEHCTPPPPPRAAGCPHVLFAQGRGHPAKGSGKSGPPSLPTPPLKTLSTYKTFLLEGPHLQSGWGSLVRNYLLPPYVCVCEVPCVCTGLGCLSGSGRPPRGELAGPGHPHVPKGLYMLQCSLTAISGQ